MRIQNIAQLIDRIGAGNFDPQAEGPVVVRATLWDGRIVTGSYYRGDSKPVVASLHDIIGDNKALRPHVQSLLDSGKSFITETGEDDMVCTLIWEIQTATV